MKSNNKRNNTNSTGCTDSSAFNYDSTATTDDGGCNQFELSAETYSTIGYGDDYATYTIQPDSTNSGFALNLHPALEYSDNNGIDINGSHIKLTIKNDTPNEIVQIVTKAVENETTLTKYDKFPITPSDSKFVTYYLDMKSNNDTWQVKQLNKLRLNSVGKLQIIIMNGLIQEIF